jgi:protein-S-isoprenylcysteine O-methyltransferase Ste14
MSDYTCLALIFGASEAALFVAKRSKASGVKNRSDKSSMLLLWIAIPLSLTAAGFIGGYEIWLFPDPSMAKKIAIGITIFGFIVRWIAIIQLGRMFTVDVSISNTHILKTSGMYKIVRHPSYLGLMLIIAGLGLSEGSILSFVVAIVPVFIAMNYRMIVEEKALINEFGAQYEDYKKRVSRIVPFIY